MKQAKERAAAAAAAAPEKPSSKLSAFLSSSGPETGKGNSKISGALEEVAQAKEKSLAAQLILKEARCSRANASACRSPKRSKIRRLLMQINLRKNSRRSKADGALEKDESAQRYDGFKSIFRRGRGHQSQSGAVPKGDDYGKPKAGSKTEARAQAAKKWVDKEIDKLVEVITKLGAPDEERNGQITITFGPLFIAYQDISDTLVGILMRSKKRKRIFYEGDMLFQGQHNHVKISILK